MGEPKRIWHTVEIIKSVRVFIPKERMLIVSACKDSENPGSFIVWDDPVLGIRVRICAEYKWSGYEGQLPPLEGATHREMIANGWRYDGYGESHRPMIVMEDSYIDADDSAAIGDGSSVLVVCTWPAEQDEEMLAPFVARAKEMARED